MKAVPKAIPKAVIAQSDLLTAYGHGIAPLWQGLMTSTTAVTSSPCFSTGKPTAHKLAMVPDLQVSPGSSRARAMLDKLLLPLAGKFDPQTTLILATTVCEIEHLETAVLKPDKDLIAQAAPTILLQHIQQTLALRGPALVMSSACASSAAALSRAAAMIQSDAASSVLVVTCDAVSEFVYCGFNTLLSLCDSPAKPFDSNRCGLSLGEAAAWALVTREDSPLACEDAPAILGWSSTSDAVHMTAPDRNAGGLSRAITAACRMAGITTDQVKFIAAHGTATLYNDAMELRAFRHCFTTPVPVFSVKGGTGHTLAAAGLVQILVSAFAMKVKTVPPTVGLTTPDIEADGWVRNQPVECNGPPLALSTNSGFGGVNTAVLLGLRNSTSNKHSTQVAPSYLRALGWISGTECGTLKPNQSTRRPFALQDNIASLIERPVKYLSRMTAEARCSLVAASLAMKAAGWDSHHQVLAIMGTGYEGCLAADAAYFQDYVDGGQSMGRANLFIYTLPTSALSEVAIALNLTGPALHLATNLHSLVAMVEQARSIVESAEAHGVLCVWSDGVSALSLAVGGGNANHDLPPIDLNEPPATICRRLAGMARES
jgi:3-oxoacyl-[acyl-carrier-protein] synthase II